MAVGDGSDSDSDDDEKKKHTPAAVAVAAPVPAPAPAAAPAATHGSDQKLDASTDHAAGDAVLAFGEEAEEGGATKGGESKAVGASAV